MAHNVQMQIHAIEDVNRKMDSEDAVKHIPTIFLEFREFVNELFTTEKPFEHIEKHASKFKDLISGERPGTSALEDQSMFPSTRTMENAPEQKSRKKVVKPVKVEPAVVNDGLFKF